MEEYTKEDVTKMKVIPEASIVIHVLLTTSRIELFSFVNIAALTNYFLVQQATGNRIFDPGGDSSARHLSLINCLVRTYIGLGRGNFSLKKHLL